MRFFAEYYLVKTVLLFTKLFPNAFVYAFCKTIAHLFFKYNQRRTTLTLKNIRLAYPHKNEEQVHTLALEAYESVAITLAETLLMFNDRLDIDSMIENKDEILEKFERYFEDTTRGKLLMTGHYSNWELLAHFLGKSGYPIKNIAREGNNHLIDERIIQPFRAKYGNKNIYKKNAIISLVKTLKQGLRVSILFDQKASGPNSVKTHFFGKEVQTVDVLAQLKLKYNPLVLPTFIVRGKNGKYTVVMKDPLEYIAQEESDETQKIIKITQRYNDTIEEVINANPEQWFWMHDRWRIAK